MSLLNTTNFERQGNTDKDIHLEGIDEIRSAIITLSSNALRSIKIFTPDLEHKLYDNEAFRESLLYFARGYRHANIQILVNDISFAIQRGHQLIHLAQKLSTAIQIKITPKEYIDTKLSFIQTDQTEFIFKVASSSPSAIQCDCKNRTNKLLDYFNPTWEQAIIAPQTQQFHI